MNKKWSKEQIKLLEDNYYDMPWDKLMKLLNVDKKQRILDKASNLGLKRIDSKWNKEEIQFIKDNFEKMSYKEIGKLLNRTEFAVCTKIGRLKLNKVTKWSKEEIEILKKNYQHMSNKNIVKLLKGRNPQRVQEMAKKLGLKKNKYTLYDLNMVKESLKEYAEKIGRTPLFEEIKVLDWCPSALSLSRYCGGYRNLCEMVGLEINQSIFGRPRYLLKSKNGDKCLSYAEQAVTNFFIDNNIKYEKEVKYSRYIKDIKNEKFCNWVLEDNTLVEYFGMMDKDYYAKKANKKLKLIKDHNLKFIELREKDLPNLMKIFKDYIT